jgi:hypothetical protein
VSDAQGRLVNEIHAGEVYTYEMYAREIHACQMYAYEVDAREIHGVR